MGGTDEWRTHYPALAACVRLWVCGEGGCEEREGGKGECQEEEGSRHSGWPVITQTQEGRVKAVLQGENNE